MSMIPGVKQYGQQPGGGGTDLSMLMQLLGPQAPQGPMGGAQAGPGGQLPGLPPGLPGQPGSGAGAPPSMAPSSSLGRDKIASALMGQTGKGLAGGAGGGASGAAQAGLGGAMQGASLAASAAGKSPLSMIKNMMAPSSPMGTPNPLTDPVAGNVDPMAFANSLSGMPPDAAAGLDPTAGNIEMNQAYLESLSPAGVDQMFEAAPAVGDLGGLGAMGEEAFGADMLASMGGEEAASAWLASLMEEGAPLAFAALL